MFNKKLISVFVTSAALSLTESAWSAVDSDAAVTGQSKGLEEVIVNARRTEENLQDIPVAVQVLSGDELQKLAMTSPTEISKLAPGLNISLENVTQPVIILRGVRWSSASGTAAIPVYLNELSFDAQNTLQTMYDISQVQVVRGPQGTSRGAPSVSGAVTITTTTPNLHDFGGYVSGLMATDDHQNIQGAVNIPIVDGKLAARIAALAEDDQGNHVSSVNSSSDPSLKRRSARVSFLFQPTDEFSLNAMYQRLEMTGNFFTQVVGSGSPGFTSAPGATAAAGYFFAPNTTVPAGYNGPAISVKDRRAVQDGPGTIDNTIEFVTLNAAWEVAGHALDYNLGLQRTVGTTSSPEEDSGNSLIGYDLNSGTDNRHPVPTFAIHELRLSSLRDQDNFIDYDAGIYYHSAHTDPIRSDNVGGVLGGALGDPSGAPSPVLKPATFSRYVLPATTNIEILESSRSIFGDMVMHLSEDTELTLGLRRIKETKITNLDVSTGDAYSALPASLVGGNCALVGGIQSPNYPTACEVFVPAAARPANSEHHKDTNYATIYNASLSHKFTEDVLAYTTVGSSWRTGLPAIGSTGLPSNLLVPAPEKATSFELGVKSSLFDRQIRLNADIFQINYTGQLQQHQFTPYWNSLAGAPGQTTQAFFTNADAQVRGFEVQIDAAPIQGLVLGAQISYAKIESAGGEAPCSDPSRPISASNVINFCTSPKGQNQNASPQLQANLSSAYTMPLGPVDGYVRLGVDYQGHNPNYGTSTESTPAYALVDLFVGVTSVTGDWDLGLYSKNLFDKQVILTKNDINTAYGIAQLFGPTGYSRVNTTLTREVGVTLKYKFGE